MSTLDRYIARQYFFNVMALLVLLFSFVMVVDVTLNIDRMFKVAAEYAGGKDMSGLARLGLVVELATDLWWPRLLQLFVFLLGMVLMGAMGFTVSQIVRHRELVAMLASGISLRRAARPILMVAALMTLVQVFDQEVIIPRIAPLLTRDHGDAGKHELSGFKVSLTSDASRRLFYASSFEPTPDGVGGELKNVVISERDPAGRLTRQIKAPSAEWVRGAWEMSVAEIRVFDTTPGQEEADATPGAAKAPLGVSTARGERIATDLDPTALMLRHYANFSHSLSWGQMHRMLDSDQLDPQLREKLERIRWGRVSTIVANFLAMLVVMPFFLTREPKNMVLQSLKCAPVGIISLLGAVLGAAAPVPGLPPALAAFLPVLVLAPIAVGSLTAMKT
jgi:lipopolysaccharide export LptBFGC system permease protein LptF